MRRTDDTVPSARNTRCATTSFTDQPTQRLGVSRRVRGVRFEPTDGDWSVGPEVGPAVIGPGEDLLLVATGRQVDPGLVSGPGLAVLGR